MKKIFNLEENLEDIENLQLKKHSWRNFHNPRP